MIEPFCDMRLETNKQIGLLIYVFFFVSSAVKFDCGRFIYVITCVYMVAYTHGGLRFGLFVV
jgi:hypothetical protein